MLVSGLRCYSYRLPLAGGGVREGILLRDGIRWADAAPLPGWSRESLDDVRSFLARGGGFDKAPASLRCAWEALHADWAPTVNKVPLSALLVGTEQEILAGASRAYREGCRCLKIKTSGVELDRLPVLLGKISREVDGACKFRLDPNRSWSFDETLRLADKLERLPVEYLEEPLAKASDLPDVISRCACPIALDETLREIPPEGLGRYQGAAALVLKPTLMGGFERCLEFAGEGARLGMVPVVSAAFESGVGIHALGRFAASLAPISAAGLDTYSRMEFDVLSERLDLSGYMFPAGQPLPAVDESRLVAL